MTEYKTCSKCGQSKPTTDYYIDTYFDRPKAACKLCCNADANARRAKYPEKHRKQNLEYYYANKDKLNEYRRAKWPELYKSKIEYHREKGKRYRAENPDKINAIARRKRARKKANGWEKYTEAQVLELYGAVCHICCEAIDLTLPRRIGVEGWEKGLQIDHVIPIAKGGPDTLANVKPSHGKCNQNKRANLPDDVQ
jgi:5-methylcytosine-specific restriction endonuclease McrA